MTQQTCLSGMEKFNMTMQGTCLSGMEEFIMMMQGDPWPGLVMVEAENWTTLACFNYCKWHMVT